MGLGDLGECKEFLGYIILGGGGEAKALAVISSYSLELLAQFAATFFGFTLPLVGI